MWLFLIFVAVPIIEIALFIQVGGFLGLWPTLAIVVLTAIAGTFLLRAQGIATLQRLQSSLSTGHSPVDPLAHGALILVAGVVLLTPGFFTDAVGLLLMVPPVRAALIKFGASRVVASNITFNSMDMGGERRDDTIDAEYSTIDPDDIDENGTAGNSGWTKR